MKFWNTLSFLFLMSYALQAQIAFEQHFSIAGKDLEHATLSYSSDGNLQILANQYPIAGNTCEKSLIVTLNKYGNIADTHTLIVDNLYRAEALNFDNDAFFVGGSTYNVNPFFWIKTQTDKTGIMSYYNSEQYTGIQPRNISYAQCLDDSGKLYVAQTCLTNVGVDEFVTVGSFDESGINIWSKILYGNYDLIANSIEFLNDKIYVLCTAKTNADSYLILYEMNNNGDILNASEIRFSTPIFDAEMKVIANKEILVTAQTNDGAIVAKIANGSEQFTKKIALNNINALATSGIAYNAQGDIFVSGLADFDNNGTPSAFLLQLDSNGNYVKDVVFEEVANFKGRNSLISANDGGFAMVFTQKNPFSDATELYIIKTNDELKTSCEQSAAINNYLTASSLSISPHTSSPPIPGATQDTLQNATIATIATFISTNLPILDLGENRIECADSVVLNAQQFGFTGFVWQDNSTNSSFLVKENGDYWVEIYSTFDCVIQQDTVNIELSELPKVEFAQDTITACLSGILLSPETYYGNLSWQNGSSTNSTYLAEKEELIYLQASNSCGTAKDSVYILIDQKPIYLGEDLSINLGDTVAFDFSHLSNVDFLWTPSTTCPTCPAVQFTPAQSTPISVSAQFSTGCLVSDTIFVTIEGSDNLILPTAFSPNNDNINDSFSVQTLLEGETVTDVKIYNRWGKMVANFKGSEQWNGKSANNEDLPMGVYPVVTSVLQANGTTKIVKSTLTLIK